jgi:hypothetical protein
MSTRKNLVSALEFNRLSQNLVNLNDTREVTANDIFLVLDLNEVQALAQPKAITLSGIQNSLSKLPVYYATTTVTDSFYSLNSTDYYISVNYSGVCTVVLPSGTDTGRVVIVKDESGAAGTGVNRNIHISGSAQIDGQAEAILSYDYGSLTFIYRDGWRII